MGTSTADIERIRVPRDDGSIAQALADLDTKIDVWTDAMRDARDCLVAAADHGGAASAPPATADAPADAAADATAAGEAATPPLPSEPDPTATEPADAGPETPDEAYRPEHIAADESTNADEAPARTLPPVEASQAGTTPVDDRGGHEPQSRPSEAAEEPGEAADADALLASLDEETAQAVCILHRLNPTAPIHDLLAEVQAKRSQSAGSASKKKKSWFSLGR
jgi:hypothetical protein